MSDLSSVQQAAENLIARRSITPDDAGCCQWLAQQLTALGFSCAEYNRAGTTNLCARYGQGARIIAFVGHSDVVPPGPEAEWQRPPFAARWQDGVLVGRGAVDMKGALAAMLAACQEFFVTNPSLRDDVSFIWLVTSDEEGSGEDGIAYALQALQQQGDQIHYALVGEPTSDQQIGDTLKVARRGSLSGYLSLLGKQGHAAYPDLAENPLSRDLALLQQLSALSWPSDHSLYPDTTLQWINLQAGLGVSNIIPGELSLEFNLRYAPPLTAASLQQQIDAVLQQHLHSTQYRLTWRDNAQAYACSDQDYINSCQQLFAQHSGQATALSASGGTSDGRHLAAHGAQVVEMGLRHHYAHQINEQVKLSELEQLQRLYVGYLQHMLIR